MVVYKNIEKEFYRNEKAQKKTNQVVCAEGKEAYGITIMLR